MRWSFAGFRLGLPIGFFAGILILSNFNLYIFLALAVNVLMIALLAGLAYRRRTLVQLGQISWPRLIAGFSAGAVVVFVLTLYSLWLTLLGVAVGYAGYMVVSGKNVMSHASLELRHLSRNLLVMFLVMAPLLFFAVLVVRGILAITGWAVAWSAISIAVIAKYIRDRKETALKAGTEK